MKIFKEILTIFLYVIIIHSGLLMHDIYTAFVAMCIIFSLEVENIKDLLKELIKNQNKNH